MIYGKIWLVVKPTVGVPLLLGSVALTSLFVHYQLINHTTWLPKYYDGAAGRMAAPAAAPAPAAPK
jgi:light-harvesting protein B-800-850 alpha chain